MLKVPRNAKLCATVAVNILNADLSVVEGGALSSRMIQIAHDLVLDRLRLTDNSKSPGIASVFLEFESGFAILRIDSLTAQVAIFVIVLPIDDEGIITADKLADALAGLFMEAKSEVEKYLDSGD